MRLEVCKETEVVEGRSKCVTANGHPYAVFKVGGQVFCLDNRCTHVGGPLCEGELDGAIVECPLHGSRFDVRTGQVVGPPARTAVRSLPAGVANGAVWVEVP